MIWKRRKRSMLNSTDQKKIFLKKHNSQISNIDLNSRRKLLKIYKVKFYIGAKSGRNKFQFSGIPNPNLRLLNIFLWEDDENKMSGEFRNEKLLQVVGKERKLCNFFGKKWGTKLYHPELQTMVMKRKIDRNNFFAWKIWKILEYINQVRT